MKMCPEGPQDERADRQRIRDHSGVRSTLFASSIAPPCWFTEHRTPEIGRRFRTDVSHVTSEAQCLAVLFAKITEVLVRLILSRFDIFTSSLCK